MTILVLDKVRLLFCFTPPPADFTSVRYRYSCISTEASRIYIHIFVACIALNSADVGQEEEDSAQSAHCLTPRMLTSVLL